MAEHLMDLHLDALEDRIMGVIESQLALHQDFTKLVSSLAEQKLLFRQLLDGLHQNQPNRISSALEEPEDCFATYEPEKIEDPNATQTFDQMLVRKDEETVDRSIHKIENIAFSSMKKSHETSHDLGEPEVFDQMRNRKDVTKETEINVANMQTMVISSYNFVEPVSVSIGRMVQTREGYVEGKAFESRDKLRDELRSAYLISEPGGDSYAQFNGVRSPKNQVKGARSPENKLALKNMICDASMGEYSPRATLIEFDPGGIESRSGDVLEFLICDVLEIEADISVAALSMDERGRIIQCVEKPKGVQLKAMQSATLTLPTNFKEDTCPKLRSVINVIFFKQLDSCVLEKLYQAFSNLCLHNLGGSLYQLIEKVCEVQISSALRYLVEQSPYLVVFLLLVENCLQVFSDQILMTRSIALYIDRTYVKQAPHERPSWDMGLQLFQQHLSLCLAVEHKTVLDLSRMIESQRLSEAIDRTLINSLLKMFTILGIYSGRFEKPLSDHTFELYAAEGIKYMQQYDVPDYMKYVETKLHEEHERSLLYLNSLTRKPLIAIVERQLLEHHMHANLDKGFVMLMDRHRTEDLQRIYSLFPRVNSLESLKQVARSYIRITGMGIVMDEEKDKDLCGVGFTNRENCAVLSKICGNTPEPFKSSGLIRKDIQEPAYLRRDCSKTKYSSPPSIVCVVLVLTLAGLFTYAWYRRWKQIIGSVFDASNSRLSTDQVKEVNKKSASPLISSIVDFGQLMQLDGSYYCAPCSEVYGILGSWKKQLMVVTDARCPDVLCYKIYLSFRLLYETSHFIELHEFEKNAKIKLKKEMGLVNGVSAKMARRIVSRLAIAGGDIHILCSLSLEKKDEWLVTMSSCFYLCTTSTTIEFSFPQPCGQGCLEGEGNVMMQPTIPAKPSNMTETRRSTMSRQAA